jgi:hypothetical protein
MQSFDEKNRPHPHPLDKSIIVAKPLLPEAALETDPALSPQVKGTLLPYDPRILTGITFLSEASTFRRTCLRRWDAVRSELLNPIPRLQASKAWNRAHSARPGRFCHATQSQFRWLQVSYRSR